MPKYKVTRTEVVIYEHEIEAESEAHAVEIAEEVRVQTDDQNDGFVCVSNVDYDAREIK